MKLIPFDPADHIETEEDAKDYLNFAREGGDEAHYASALADVERARARWAKEASGKA